MPAHMPGSGGPGPTEVYYPRTEKHLEGGGFHSAPHNMCFENSDNSYGMSAYPCYPMYDRLDSHGPSQPMNLVSKQPGFCAGSNGSIYQSYQNSQNFNHGQSYTDDRPNCVKNEDSCVPTPPPSYSVHDQPHHPAVSQMHGSDLSHLATNPAARMNGLSPAPNMQVFPWMGSTINGGTSWFLISRFSPLFTIPVSVWVIDILCHM